MSQHKVTVHSRDKQGFHKMFETAVDEDDLDMTKVTDHGELKLVLKSEPLHTVIYARGYWATVEVQEFE